MPQVRANGIDIEYQSFGREGDPLIVLIMGFAAQLIFWPESLCEGLAARGFRVVRFDNRDIGLSTHLTDLGAPDIGALYEKAASGLKPEAPYSLSDMADDAVGLMDALGVDRAHIVGASMGGMIAQFVAINHPDRTKSLTSIMSTTGRRTFLPAILTRLPCFSGRRRAQAAKTSSITASWSGTRSRVLASRKTKRTFAPSWSGLWIARPTTRPESRVSWRRSSPPRRATNS